MICREYFYDSDMNYILLLAEFRCEAEDDPRLRLVEVWVSLRQDS